MNNRNIDMSSCLRRYTQSRCNLCIDICPEHAITEGHIDQESCTGCGLCTAVCPVGAIASANDYAASLSRIFDMEQTVLACRNIDPDGPECLGFLNRRILSAIGMVRGAAIDISRCAGCNPAVADWLEKELNAANDALESSHRPKIKTTVVQPPKKKPSPVSNVSRRHLFSELMNSVRSGLKSAVPQNTRPERFNAQNAVAVPLPDSLQPGITVSTGCTACHLCVTVCPANALQMTRTDKEIIFIFRPEACIACNLCVDHCPKDVLNLIPSFDGERIKKIPRS